MSSRNLAGMCFYLIFGVVLATIFSGLFTLSIAALANLTESGIRILFIVATFYAFIPSVLLFGRIEKWIRFRFLGQSADRKDIDRS